MKYEVFNMSVSESWGILVRSSHRLAAKEFVKADDLKKEKLIVPENTSLRNDIREWIGPGLHIAAAYTLLRNAMILTEVSDWVTVCLETQKYVTKNLVFVPLRPERIRLRFRKPSRTPETAERRLFGTMLNRARCALWERARSEALASMGKSRPISFRLRPAGRAARRMSACWETGRATSF